MKNTKLLLALFGLLAGVAQAGTFNLFQPANGLLKGQSSTYVTTAATSGDVIATWSGVCSSSTYLRGDGMCASAAITGAALTKTDDTNVTVSLGGSPTTALVNATSLTLGWTGTLAASRGGLGMSTVTDDTLAVANGTIWQSKAVPDCDTATSVLQYDTSTNAFSCGTNASPAGAALTKTDDTNVTLTLGGSPTTALVNAASITAGWTGQLGVSRGGTGAATLTGVLQGNGTGAVTAITNSSTTGQTLRVTGASTYGWGALDLANSSAVTGTLPAGNGGTGVTSLGTLSKVDDTNVTLTLGGTPTGSLINSTSLTLGWTGQLSAARGGTGISTVTDDTVLVANGSAWQSKALTDCDAATSAVTYDVTTNAWGCNTINGATGANPTGTIGLSAVNGVATTFLRSDGAPALSQSIVPTWTGQHNFTALATVLSNTGGPLIRFTDGDAGTDTTNWRMRNNGGTFLLSTENDAGTVQTNALSFARTGAAITGLTFGNGTDNPAYAFSGSGTLTASGRVTGNAAAAEKFRLQSADTSGDAYLGFYENDGTTRKGYLGYGNAADDQFFIANEEAANVLIQTTGSTRLTVGTSAISTALPLNVDSGATANAFNLNSTASNGAYLSLQRSGTAKADIGLGTNCGGSFTADALCLDARSGFNVEMAAGGRTSPDIQVTNAGAINLNQATTISTSGTARLTTTASGVTVGAPTGGAQGNGTLNATGLYINGVSVAGGTTVTGTFSPTFTGFGVAPSCTIVYRLTGSYVTMFVQAAGNCTGSSNATSMTISNIPSAIRPTGGSAGVCGFMTDNGNDVPACVALNTTGTATFYTTAGGTLNASGWTSSGTKGLGVWVMSWDLRN